MFIYCKTLLKDWKSKWLLPLTYWPQNNIDHLWTVANQESNYDAYTIIRLYHGRHTIIRPKFHFGRIKIRVGHIRINTIKQYLEVAHWHWIFGVSCSVCGQKFPGQKFPNYLCRGGQKMHHRFTSPDCAAATNIRILLCWGLFTPNRKCLREVACWGVDPGKWNVLRLFTKWLQWSVLVLISR